ncbi:MAG TPA: hypothetical protein VJR89_07980 [Polyangiales bacterium]|nr:hypothetical protein [Polyangiales bacterium]
MIRHNYLMVFLVWAASGCAVTIGGGRAHAGHAKPTVWTGTLAVTTHAFRDGGGIFGVRLVSTVEHGFELRSGMFHAGYDWRVVPGWVVFEPGVDIGAGSPMSESFESLGAYAGVGANLRVRVWGVQDSMPAYNVYGGSTEIVLTPRFGGWMPPEGNPNHDVVLEWSIELGVRFAIASDLLTRSQGKLSDTDSRPPETKEGAR